MVERIDSSMEPRVARMPQSAKTDMDVGVLKHSKGTRVEGVDRWLDAHADALVWLVILVGLYVRIQRAGASYLDGDETQVMLPALQHTLRAVYVGSTSFPYGPFLFY